MDLVVLGSGTCIPSPARGSPGYLVRSPCGKILMDCGSGSLRAAAAAGAGPGEIDAVLISHFHTDHNLDLQALLFALGNEMYGGRPRLDLVGPVGFGRILEDWRSGRQGKWLEPDGFEVRLREIAEGTHLVAGHEVTAVRVEHAPESLGYRVRETPNGPVIGYSGDTGFCEGAIRIGRDADLFVLECSHADDRPSPGHLTPTEAGEIAAGASCRRLVLTHLYPDVEDEPIEEIVGRAWSGPVERAVDGKVYSVGECGGGAESGVLP